MISLENLSRRQILASFLAIGLFAGIILTYAAFSLDNVSKQQAGEKVVSTLETQSGQQLELLNVESQNSLYKVNVRSQNDQVQTYYVTKDGKMLSSAAAVTDIDQLNAAMAAGQQFTQCLQDRNMVIFGNASQQATVLQLRALQANQVDVAPFYADVNNPEVLQQASQLGVQRLPAFYYNGSAVQGVQQMQQLEEFTGCDYSLESN